MQFLNYLSIVMPMGVEKRTKCKKQDKKCTISVHRLKEYIVEHDWTIRSHKKAIFVKIYRRFLLKILIENMYTNW